MQNEQTEAIINSIGATVELMATIRDRMEEHDFTEPQIMAACLEFLRCMVIKDYGRQSDAER